MKRIDAARAGAQKLMLAEAAIDAALRETAELMGLLPSLRLQANLSAVIGQDAVDDLGQTLSHILAARRTIVSAHGGLQIVREQIGCKWVSVGEVDKPEDVPRTGGFHAVEGGRAA
jgi:hypothetical protein